MTDHPLRNTPAMDAFWMPFTANRQFKAAPRLFASANGMHYTTTDGRSVRTGGGLRSDALGLDRGRLAR